jgi:hypothetical protein
MPTRTAALFTDRHTAHAAVEQLVQAGFPRDAISVVMSEATHEREFGCPSSEKSGVRLIRIPGVLGAIVAGLVALPSTGGVSLRAAGPLGGALLRAPEGSPSSVAPEAFAAAGLTEDEARFLYDGVERGSIVVGVQTTGDRARLASQLLELSGGAALQAA